MAVRSIDVDGISLKFGSRQPEYDLRKIQQGNYRLYAVKYWSDGPYQPYDRPFFDKARLTIYGIRKSADNKWYINTIDTRIYTRYNDVARITESASQTYGKGMALIRRSNQFRTLSELTDYCRKYLEV